MLWMLLFLHEILSFQFKYPARCHVYFMAICVVTAWSDGNQNMKFTEDEFAKEPRTYSGLLHLNY